MRVVVFELDSPTIKHRVQPVSQHQVIDQSRRPYNRRYGYERSPPGL